MMRKNLTVLFAVAVTVCMPVAWGQSLGPVIMPETDLMLQVKLQSIQNSPIFRAMAEMKDQEKELTSQAGMAGIENVDKFAAGLRTVTGLAATDFLSLVATADLDGMAWEDKPELDKVRAIVGMRLAKELPIDRLETGLKTFAASHAQETGTTPPTISRVAIGDTPVLQVKEADKENSVCLAVAEGNKILLIGKQDVLEGALDRYASGKTVSPRTLFHAAVGKAVSRGNCYVIVKPTADMIAIMTETNEAAPLNPTAALMTKLETSGIGLNFAETLDLAVVSQFADAEAAKQASMLADAQAVSGIKMFATMMTGGALLPMLQTMKTGAGDTGTAWFKLSVSKQDLDLFVKAMKQKMQQAPTPIPMPMEE